MKAGERYFFAAVDLSTAKDRIERIIQSLNEHKLAPSMELIAACISDLQGAMLKIHHERLSDRRNDFCQIRDCGGNGRFHLCLKHAGEEIQRRNEEEEK